MKNYDYIYLSSLVKKAKNGNSNAFAELYAATYQAQYQFALHYLKDEYLAQDAIQEVYILVLKNLSRLKDVKLFLAWMRQINFHICFDIMQKRKQENPELCNKLLEALKDSNEEANIEKQIADEDMRNQILDLLQTFPSNEYLSIIMRYYNDMQLQEIAEAMNCSLSSVKRYLSSGLKRLKHAIKKEENGYA